MFQSSESDIINAAKLVRICDFSYKDSREGETYLNYKVIKVLNLEPKILNKNKNGFYGVALESNNEIIVAFRGTCTIQDWLTDINIGLLDNCSGQIKEALKFFEKVYKMPANKDKTLFVTGHSLGGGLAEIIGAKYNVPTYTFNGLGMKSMLNNYQLDKNKEYSNIKNFISKIDLVGNLLPHVSQKDSSYYYVNKPADIINRKDFDLIAAEAKALIRFASTINMFSESVHKLSSLIREKLLIPKDFSEYAIQYDMEYLEKQEKPAEIWFLAAHKLSNFYELSENDLSSTNELLKK
jgi:hypothetical protein